MQFDHAKFFELYRNQYGKLTQGQVDGLEALLSGLEQDADVSDVSWAAYMLATVKHECADTWTPITERGPKLYFEKYEPTTQIGKDLGNTQSGDGFRFRGRGYVQITGRANYAKLGNALGLGNAMIDDPDQALDPAIAYRIMSHGMRNGSFTGKKLAVYMNDGACDYLNARRIINRLDQAEKIKGYAEALEKILQGSIVP